MPTKMPRPANTNVPPRYAKIRETMLDDRCAEYSAFPASAVDTSSSVRLRHRLFRRAFQGAHVGWKAESELSHGWVRESIG